MSNMKKVKDLKVLFLDILTNDPKIKDEINAKVYKDSSYSEATRKIFGLEKKQWDYLDAGKDNLPKEIGAFDAVVIGGSVADPIEGHESKWMHDTYAFIKRIADKKIPILGICGGLQFTVRALGGKVIRNPKGRELDVLPLKLTTKGRSDPLFKGLPKNVFVCSSHKCMAERIDPKWELLASSKLCDIHAIAIGDRIRLTQFHPEMKVRELKAIAEWRREPLIKEGFFKDAKDFDRSMQRMKKDDKAGKKIIQNFLKYIVLPKRMVLDKKSRLNIG